MRSTRNTSRSRVKSDTPRVILSREDGEGSPSHVRRGVLAALGMTLALSCSNPSAPTTVRPQPTTLPTVTLGDGYVVRVEVAADDELRAQGLMYRDRLRDGHGMIFLFPRSGVYPFWMKNTLIPLDILWIDEQKRVAHVKFDVPPCQADPCPSYDPGVSARYVLEVAGGVAREHAVRAGEVVKFDGLDNVTIR